jgi:leucyl aminopeptidase
MKEKTLAIPRFEGDRALRGSERDLDRRLGGAIDRRLRLGDYKGRSGDVTCLFPDREAGIERVLLFGLGPRGEITIDRLRHAVAALVPETRRAGVRRLAIHLPEGGRLSHEEKAAAFAEGVLLASYRFDRYRPSASPPETALARVVLVAGRESSSLARATRRARIVASASNFAKEIASTPASDLPPAALATASRRLAREHGLQCRVLDRRGIEAAGMGALLAVGQGSRNTPRFIHLEWVPSSKSHGKIVLIGKGITFDSGGISLKPSNNMWDMKFDKSGAAAVLGAIRAVADLALPVRVAALVPAAENMPSGSAYRPGDVVNTAAGKTVEVRSTDAEGRLVLADALHYARRLSPDVVLDLATLTGACAVALGEEAAGLFGNDERILEQLTRAGEETGERLWRLPLWKEYDRLIESDVADLKNTGGRYAGAITAAAFLAKFAGEVPWAHVDIAGPAFVTSARGYRPKGATGFGVRVVTQFIRNYCKQEA